MKRKPRGEFELYQALKRVFPPDQFAVLPQVGNSTGYETSRHADAIALGLWPSRGIYLHGFEIKSCRSDWVRELAKPQKAEEIASRCNYWWVVAAHTKIIGPGEVPEPWGLLVWSEKTNALVRQKPARFRKAPRPDLGFLAAILRQAQPIAIPQQALKKAEEKGYARAKQEAESFVQDELREFGKLKQRLHDFEQTSGIDISRNWSSGKRIGEAVNVVLNGTGVVERGRENLLRTAREIIAALDGVGGN